MKKIYLTYDVIGEEVIDAFVRKNNDAAKRDFIFAFQRQGKDSTRVKLYEAYPLSEIEHPDLVEGIPVKEIWDSNEFEEVQEPEKEN